jgi:hypothetical protein
LIPFVANSRQIPYTSLFESVTSSSAASLLTTCMDKSSVSSRHVIETLLYRYGDSTYTFIRPRCSTSILLQDLL